MTTLTILRGLPGSGKSTWARQHADSNTVIVSLDGLRTMMAGGRQAWHETMNPQMNRLLVRQAHTIVSDLLAKGVNVISDSQHVNPRFCVDEMRIASRHKAHVETVTFDVPLDELLERNMTRVESDRVPEEYLRTQYESWHGYLEHDSRWVNVRAMKTDGVYHMNPIGETVMVDVGLLWDNNARTVDDAEMGYTAASANGRDATGTVRLDMPLLKDGRKWTLDRYSKWLEQGAHKTNDGFADFSTDGRNLLELMRDSDNVNVRPVKGETDVYACNFSRDAFRSRRWVFQQGTRPVPRRERQCRGTRLREVLQPRGERADHPREHRQASQVPSARGTQGERVPRLGVHTRRRFVAFLVEEWTD